MNVFLHINWWSGTLLKSIIYPDFLTDGIQIKLWDIATFALILMICTLISRLCCHTHLSGRITDNSISSYWWTSLLHLNLLSLHLTGSSLNCRCAISNLSMKVRHRHTRLFRLWINNRVLSLATGIGTTIDLIDGLLNSCHVDHRLLGLVWAHRGQTGISLLLSGGRLMHLGSLGKQLSIIWQLLLSDSCRYLLMNCILFLNLGLIMVQSRLLVLGWDTRHVFLKYSLIQRNLS